MAKPERSLRSSQTAQPSRNDVRGLATLAVGVVDRVAAPVAGMHQAVADRVFERPGARRRRRPPRPRLADRWRPRIDPLGQPHPRAGRRRRVPGRVGRPRPALPRPVVPRHGSRRSPRSTPRSATSCTRPGATWPSPCSCSTEASRGPRARWTSRAAGWWCSCHGLGGSERSWPTGPGDRTSYIDLLEDGLDATALALRYNSGRHVSDNGRGAVRPPRAAGARLAGSGGIARPRGALDGWARGPLRLPHRRRARPGVAVPGAPRRLPGHAAPRCAARAGRPARPQRPRSARRDAATGRARSGPQRRHQGPLPRLRRRGGLDRAVTSTASTTTATSCRCCPAPSTASSPPR